MTGPPIEGATPPATVIKIANPVVKRVLRSPLHRLLSGRVMLLTVTGRKSGRTYTVPVGRHEAGDGAFLVSADGEWRHNLRGGADVRVTLDGRDRKAHVTPVEDPDRAAELFQQMLGGAGARMLAVKVNVDRTPTVAEIKPVIAKRLISRLELVD